MHAHLLSHSALLDRRSLPLNSHGWPAELHVDDHSLLTGRLDIHWHVLQQ